MDNKPLIWNLVFILLIILSSTFVYPIESVKGFVTDEADLLSLDEEIRLRYFIQGIEKNSTYEIAIVTVPDTGGDDTANYAIQLGERSGVGKADEDNGVVILWSVTNQRGGFIAVGRGIEHILTDAEVGRIGREAKPHFDRREYFEGFNKILTAINAKIQSETTTSEAINKTEIPIFIYILIGVLLCLIIFISLIHTNKQSSIDADDAFVAGAATGVLLSKNKKRKSNDVDEDDDSSDSVSFGGGRGGFGGGSFGGGGARF